MTGETPFATGVTVKDVQDAILIDNEERTITATLKYLSEELISGYNYYLVLKFEDFAEGATVTLVNTNTISSPGYAFFGIDAVNVPETLTINDNGATVQYALDLELLPES